MGCRAESPHFAKVKKDLADDRLAVLDVFLKQDPEKVRRFAAKKGYDFLFLRDPEAAARGVFDFKMTPLIVVIDAEGTLRYRGGVTKAEELAPIVAAALGEAPKPPAAVEPAPPPAPVSP